MTIYSIYEWMKITYVSSMEKCGIEVDVNKTLTDYTNSDLVEYYYGIIKPRIVCNDGFSMSVQGGYNKYSTPRATVEIYVAMEIGFPTNWDDPELEDNDGQVVGYVPVEDIQKIIKRHGGINSQESLKDWNYKNSLLFKQKKLREIKLKRILNEKKD